MCGMQGPINVCTPRSAAAETPEPTRSRCGPARFDTSGRYLKKVVVSTTTGPGIPVDPAVTRNFTEA
jgi:hypothetical protein